MEIEKSIPIRVPSPEVMSASYVAYVPNHMKYTSQGSGNSYIPAGFVTFS